MPQLVLKPDEIWEASVALENILLGKAHIEVERKRGKITDEEYHRQINHCLKREEELKCNTGKRRSYLDEHSFAYF